MAKGIQILRTLGQGGMGEVFLAELWGEEGFRRKVAIKRLHPRAYLDEGLQRTFIQEARICAKLHHPNIVQVFDLERDDRGRLGLIMEYVQGQPLSAVMTAHKGPFEAGVALYLIRHLLYALDYAHTLKGEDQSPLQIVHRDVKPSNILVDHQGHLKLMDFGLALMRDRLTDQTAQGIVKGTASYMSPEQVRGQALDQRTDLFSVGIVLWELLTGERLFIRQTIEETCQAVLFENILAPSQQGSGVPPSVDAFVMKLLHRSIDERYPSAQAALADLLKLGHSSTKEESKAQAQLSLEVSSSAQSSGAHWLSLDSKDLAYPKDETQDERPKALVPWGSGAIARAPGGTPSAIEAKADSVHLKLGPSQARSGQVLWALAALALLAISIGLTKQLIGQRSMNEVPRGAAIEYGNARFKSQRFVAASQKPAPPSVRKAQLADKPKPTRSTKEDALWEQIRKDIDKDRLYTK